MNRNEKTYRMVLAAVLCAVGILIPLTFPKFSLPPMSFTLASHVAIFIAMFLSPGIAAAVALVTTFGFFLVLPLPVVLRAGTHIIWAVLGAFWLKSHPDLLYKPVQSGIFCLVIGAIHGLCEALVLIPLYVGNLLAPSVYESGFLTYIVLLVGVGALVHSSVDYVIALLVWRPLRHMEPVAKIATAR